MGVQDFPTTVSVVICVGGDHYRIVITEDTAKGWKDGTLGFALHPAFGHPILIDVDSDGMVSGSLEGTA